MASENALLPPDAYTKRHNTPVSAKRKRLFLKVLRETGSMSAAASAASPSAKTRTGALSSFRTAMKLDPHFAQEVADAKEEALGRVETLVMERAITPDERPVFSRGELVAWAKDHRGANQMLLRVLEALAPEKWAPKKNISGDIAHTHDHRSAGDQAMFVLEPRHVLLLDEQEQELLLALLGRVRDRLQLQEGPHDAGRPDLADAADGHGPRALPAAEPGGDARDV